MEFHYYCAVCFLLFVVLSLFLLLVIDNYEMYLSETLFQIFHVRVDDRIDNLLICQWQMVF